MTLFAWHVHHDQLFEPLTEPIENRIASIKKKPKDEIETRLRLLKSIRGRLPVEIVKAWEAYVKALVDHKVEIETLHREECPNCPWNGETIFPEGEKE